MKSGPATKATPSSLAAASSAGGVDVLGEVEPEEVAALGDDELGLGDLLAERLDQRVAALGERRVDELDVARRAPPDRQSSKTIDSASMFGEM